MEVAGLLRHKVEQQLREAGDLSYVQFQLLARLGLDSPTGSQRMTDLADGVVYSRSGLTYQAGLLEKAGLGRARRHPSTTSGRHGDDHRGRPRAAGRGASRPRRGPPRATVRGPDARTTSGPWPTLLEPVRDHMRAAPPRSAEPRRRR